MVAAGHGLGRNDKVSIGEVTNLSRLEARSLCDLRCLPSGSMRCVGVAKINVLVATHSNLRAFCCKVL